MYSTWLREGGKDKRQVDVRLWRSQLDRAWALEPWSREVVDAADTYAEIRRKAGYSGRFWYQFAWVDDTSAASLRVFTATVRRVRYAVWKELNWIWDTAKSTQYLYGQRLVPPTVGLELRATERRIELPASKMDKYEKLATELCADAERHPRSSSHLDMVLDPWLSGCDPGWSRKVAGGGDRTLRSASPPQHGRARAGSKLPGGPQRGAAHLR